MVSDDVSVSGSVVLEKRDLVSGLRRAQRAVWVIFPILVAASVIYGVAASDPYPVATTALCVFGLVWALRVQTDRNAGKTLALSTDTERAHAYRFDRQGIEIESGMGMALLNWPGIHRFSEGRDTFLVYATEAIMHIVPKRAFAPEHVNIVRAMLGERIKMRPRTRLYFLGMKRILLLWALLILAFVAIWLFLSGAKR